MYRKEAAGKAISLCIFLSFLLLILILSPSFVTYILYHTLPTNRDAEQTKHIEGELVKLNLSVKKKKEKK